jgi:hypothetical protein
LGTQNQDEDGLYSKSGLEDRFWILVAACPRVAKTMLKLRKCFCLWMVMCKQSVPRTNYNLKKHLASQSRRPTIAASPGCEALQLGQHNPLISLVIINGGLTANAPYSFFFDKQ